MVGGEALPLKLAKELRSLVPGQLVNMYGPTEATIWSTTCELREIGDFVPLGEPIANTTLRVVTASRATIICGAVAVRLAYDPLCNVLKVSSSAATVIAIGNRVIAGTVPSAQRLKQKRLARVILSTH